MIHLLAISAQALSVLGPQAKVLIVSCDAQIQSLKRGVAANELKPADFRALEPGVSWWYNWGHHYTDRRPKNCKMEFFPMVWGDVPEHIEGLRSYLKEGNRPRRILAINEPNLNGQAYISPIRTAKLYRTVKAIADPYRIPVVGPQMAIGSPDKDSIVTFDPFTKKGTIYNFMVPFMNAFLHYTEPTPVYGMSIHPYGPYGEAKWAVGLMEQEYKRPVWVTEFSHVESPSAGLEYLMQTVDMFERTPSVEGYAWFKERAEGDDAKISLLAPKSGELTTLGQAYVAMPVHDPLIYYRIPGRLQAERYVRMSGAEIHPTSDESGLADMENEAGEANLTYNLNVPKSGIYSVKVRIQGPAGMVTLKFGKNAISVTEDSPNPAWRTLTFKLNLSQGNQTLDLGLGGKGQRVNWLEFAAVKG